MLIALFTTAALATTWQQPPQEVLDVLHAPQNPQTWVSPTAASSRPDSSWAAGAAGASLHEVPWWAKPSPNPCESMSGRRRP